MSGVVLDEVHCLWPSCSHTCCWEAEQRIREGHPRVLRGPGQLFTRPCTGNIVIAPHPCQPKWKPARTERCLRLKRHVCAGRACLSEFFPLQTGCPLIQMWRQRDSLKSCPLPPSSGCRDMDRAHTACPKGQIMNPKFRPRAFKNTDMKLSGD